MASAPASPNPSPRAAGEAGEKPGTSYPPLLQGQSAGGSGEVVQRVQRAGVVAAGAGAVIDARCGISFTQHDVYLNIAGGLKVTEPAADLAVLLAIQGSLRGRALPRGFIAFGEVGLAGEVRPAPRGQERLKEAAKLGFSVAVVPKANAPKKAIEGLTIHAVERVEQAMEVVRSLT